MVLRALVTAPSLDEAKRLLGDTVQRYRSIHCAEASDVDGGKRPGGADGSGVPGGLALATDDKRTRAAHSGDTASDAGSLARPSGYSLTRRRVCGW